MKEKIKRKIEEHETSEDPSSKQAEAQRLQDSVKHEEVEFALDAMKRARAAFSIQEAVRVPRLSYWRSGRKLS